MKEQNYEISVTKMATEDHYENGCSLESQDFGLIDTHHVSALSDLPNIIALYTPTNVGIEPSIYDDRVEVTVTENAQGTEPTKEEKEKFKKGEVKLFCVDYSFHIQKVEKKVVDHFELVAAFGPGTDHEFEDHGCDEDFDQGHDYWALT